MANSVRNMCRRAVQTLAVVLGLVIATAHGTAANASDERLWAALKSGAIIMIRHAHAPGFGDPAGFDLKDCKTQRNLDAKGRDQARQLGEAFKSRAIAIHTVVSSEWCRTRDTALGAFGPRIITVSAFNSFFDTPDRRSRQTAEARAFIMDWHRSNHRPGQRPGALVVVTHQVNIAALTEQSVRSSEAVVLDVVDNRLVVLGTIQPPQ